MANYMAFTRTNYFSVVDEEKFRSIVSSISAEDQATVFENELPDGKKQFGFGCYGCIYGLVTEDDEGGEDEDALHNALQQVLSEGDAIIITEVGYEKLRYLWAGSLIITKSNIEHIHHYDAVMQKTRAILGNSQFTTQLDY